MSSCRALSFSVRVRPQSSQLNQLKHVTSSSSTAVPALVTVHSREFATRVARPTRANQFGGGRVPVQPSHIGHWRMRPHPGYIGKGERLRTPRRRWRGGRYNFYDWPTLVQALRNCPSVIDRDRFPSPHELDLFYKGAWRGVRHHGGPDFMAQLLNLSPYRQSVIRSDEYPRWIEEAQILKAMRANDGQSVAEVMAGNRSAHRHCLPPFLRDLSQTVRNIQGKRLSGNDKRRVVHSIYKRVNTKLKAEDMAQERQNREQYKSYKELRRSLRRDEESHLQLGYDEQVEDAHPYKAAEDRRYARRLSMSGTHVLLETEGGEGHIQHEAELDRDLKGLSGRVRKYFRKRSRKKLAKKEAAAAEKPPVPN